MTVPQDVQRAGLRVLMTASMPDYLIDSEAGGRVEDRDEKVVPCHRCKSCHLALRSRAMDRQPGSPAARPQ